MTSLLSLYKQRFNLQNATFTRIDYQDSIVAIAYKVTQPNGEELILKICTRTSHYRCEVFFNNYFADRLPAPHIRNTVAPEEGLQGAILMDCLPGTLLKSPDLPEFNDLKEFRWWTLDELLSSPEHFAPSKISYYLQQLLAKGTPIAPIDVGI
mgnify:CR=1 FL=1|tara:strand:- start:735 stop:1193 length:459 start_codon:yes stop_codon:yes gene_type:complete